MTRTEWPCRPSSVPAPAAAVVCATLLGMTTRPFSYALKLKHPGGLCLIIIGTEGASTTSTQKKPPFSSRSPTTK
jgi:hypothetical protein